MSNWKLVPLEPTLGMVMAGEKAFEDQLDARLKTKTADGPLGSYPSETIHILPARAAYRAMLAVSPEGDWRDDDFDAAWWNAGLDFGLSQLCDSLGVDRRSFNIDRATEDPRGEVLNIVHSLLSEALGSDWDNRASLATTSETARLPQDVIDLVIAGRIVAFDDQSPEALFVLDTALEAFASRVPWDDEPTTPETAKPDTSAADCGVCHTPGAHWTTHVHLREDGSAVLSLLVECPSRLRADEIDRLRDVIHEELSPILGRLFQGTPIAHAEFDRLMTGFRKDFPDHPLAAALHPAPATASSGGMVDATKPTSPDALDEVKRILDAAKWSSSGGDKEDVLSYAKEVVRVRSEREALSKQVADLTKEQDEANDGHAAELEEARTEGYNEGYEEGQCEARGAHGRVFRFIYRWLKDRGLCFDDGEGINEHDVADGLALFQREPTAYERQRADAAQKLADQRRARIASLEAALAEQSRRADEAAEEHAALVEAMLSRRPFATFAPSRAALMLAARAIRRGRHLTDEERAANLQAYLAGEQPAHDRAVRAALREQKDASQEARDDR